MTDNAEDYNKICNSPFNANAFHEIQEQNLCELCRLVKLLQRKKKLTTHEV